MALSKQELAARVHAVAHIRGTFTLRSGLVSDVYFDKYAFESDPELLREVATAVAERLPTDVNALAGLELGGIPLATLISQQTSLPLLFVRKQAKSHGTCKQIEGPDPSGLRVAIVEDVVTSGGAILEAIEALRASGAEVNVAVCAIDREAGATEALAECGVSLGAAYTANDLEAAVVASSRGAQ